MWLHDVGKKRSEWIPNDEKRAQSTNEYKAYKWHTERRDSGIHSYSWSKPVIAPNLCKWKDKCENQLQSKWFRRKDTETFPSECSKMGCLRYISLYCLCIIMAIKTTYSQSHRSVVYLTAATAAHRVERIPICSFKIRSCFNAAHVSWWMIFIFISLHSNKLYFLDTLSYY